jgi:hypothetical protein
MTGSDDFPMSPGRGAPIMAITRKSESETFTEAQVC